MSIDAYVTLDKLCKDPGQISDNSKSYSRCSSEGNEDDNSIAQSNNDAPKLKYLTLDQSRTHNSTFEVSINPRVFEEVKDVKPEHKEQKTPAQEDKLKELQVENEHLQSIWKKSRELDIRQKNEIAELQQENEQLKQELSGLQMAMEQFKGTIEDLSQYGKESKAQVQLLSPASWWNIDHDELTITGNVLGTGAWGFVKEGAFHGTKVAVKGIHQAITSAADEVIPREFDMMAQVRHPNLVLLIGAVFNDPRHRGPLIITELLDCDMRSAYEEGKLDRQCRLPLLRDVAAALNYLHSRKQPIIHRDISSANVMLEASGNGKWKRAKLCDFGSAKLTSLASTPAPGAAIYSAPETLPPTKGEQTVKVDVYSFGVLYCEILLARLPPNLDPTTDDFSKFISDLKRLEGKDIHHTAHICTHKNPKKRPIMQDVLHDIDQHIIASTTK